MSLVSWILAEKSHCKEINWMEEYRCLKKKKKEEFHIVDFKSQCQQNPVYT